MALPGANTRAKGVRAATSDARNRAGLEDRVAKLEAAVAYCVRALRERTSASMTGPQRRVADLIAAQPAAFERLDERQRQVLQMVADGYTNRQIAERLFTCVRTVARDRKAAIATLEFVARL